MATTPSPSDSRFHYLAFGLRIASELELPELTPDLGGATGQADIDIAIGAVSETLPGAQAVEEGIWARPGALLIDYPEARYLICDGAQITVQPVPGAQDRDVRLYLLGSAMGAMLHQRGLLPLHANAIEIDGKAVAFAGPSGAGKSTLAAHFLALGHRVLCDDVCVVSFGSEGAPMAWPGIPRIKLWADALDALGQEKTGLERVWTDWEKFSLPTMGQSGELPLPLAGVYVLSHHSDNVSFGVDRVFGLDAFSALTNNIYRWEFAAPLGVAKEQFTRIRTLVDRVPVFDVARIWGLDVLAAEIAQLLQHSRGHTGVPVRR